MTLLFGQHPQGSMADRQTVTHGMVGSIGDLTPPRPLPPMGGGGGGGGRTYFRRNTITPVAPILDDDVIAALTVFTILENDTP